MKTSIYNSNITLIIVLVLSKTIAYSQSAFYMTYKKQTYDWSKNEIKYEVTTDSFKKFDAYIVSEKIDYYFFSEHKQVHNHLKLKANNDKGLEKISTIDLPQHLSYPDEMYYDPEAMRDTLLRPLIRDVEIVRFGARIIKADGSVVNADVKDYTKYVTIKYHTQSYNIYKYFFTITNLQKDDILEIDYLYNIPYKGNFNGYSTQNKVNFTSLLPKQEFICKMEWETKNTFVYITGFNQAEKFDTIIDIKNGRQTYIWKLKDFYKVADETNNHLYNETPYVKFYYPFYINSPELSYRRHMIWYDLLDDSYNVNKNSTMKLDPEINSVVDLYRKYKYSSSDTSILSKLKEIHHFINYNLKYKDDTAYFAGDDLTLGRIDLNLKENIFRYKNRDKFYKYLFDATNGEYFIGIIPDKRVDIINIDVPNYIDEEMFFYVLNYENKPYYFYPKLFDHGYHVNELPFYVENQSVLLCKQNIGDAVDLKNYIGHITPASLKNDNYRGIKSQVIISIKNNTSTIKSTLSLTGQMSTMCRHSYITNIVNQFANLDYGKRIYDVGNSHLIKQTIKNENEEYPFKTDFEIEYSTDLITSIGDKKILNLNRLIIPITPYKFENIRTTNFYTDFMFKDNYRYMLQFDEDVVIDEINENFTNTYGKINFNLTKVDSKTYSIVCIFDIYKNMATPNEYADVKAYYEFVNKIESMKIELK